MFGLSDRITVMRDGRYISTHNTKDVTIEDIVREMVGRDVDQLFPKEVAPIGEPLLTVSGLGRVGVFRDIDLTVRAGEIVALAGLVGAGRTEVARAIFGIDPYDVGTVEFLGQPLKAHDAQAAINAGMGFVPEDRRKQGLVMDLSVDTQRRAHAAPAAVPFGLINGAQGARNGARSGRRDSRSRPSPSSTPCPPCPAAINRRSCSRNGWPPNRSC